LFRRRFLTLLVLAGVFAGNAGAGPRPTGEPATVDELVAEVQKTYAGVTSVRANFTQTTRNQVTGAAEAQKGRLLMQRPRRLRIEIGTPVRSAVVSDGATMWIYAAEVKQVIVQKELGGSSGVGVLLDDLGRLSELFTAELREGSGPRPGHLVHLVPRQAAAYKSIDLSVGKARYLLQRLVITDAMDGVTDMEFSGVLLNTPVAAAEFTFKAPPGVQVIQGG
jgi:outer membrane lipoprotein carrier protein